MVVLTSREFRFSLLINQLLAKAIPVRGARFKKACFRAGFLLSDDNFFSAIAPLVLAALRFLCESADCIRLALRVYKAGARMHTFWPRHGWRYEPEG